MAQEIGFLPQVWETWIKVWAPDFSLCLAPAITDIWEMNEQIGSLCACVSLSFSLYHSVFASFSVPMPLK